MRRKHWFMFPAQDLRDLCCQATQNLPLGINNIPLGLQISGLSTICLHFCSLQTFQDIQPVPDTAHAVGPLNQGVFSLHALRYWQTHPASNASALPISEYRPSCVPSR